jgi:hypothetical protein
MEIGSGESGNHAPIQTLTGDQRVLKDPAIIVADNTSFKAHRISRVRNLFFTFEK